MRRLFVLRLELPADLFVGRDDVLILRLTHHQLPLDELIEQAAALLIEIELTGSDIGETGLDETIEGRSVDRIAIQLENDRSLIVLVSPPLEVTTACGQQKPAETKEDQN